MNIIVLSILVLICCLPLYFFVIKKQKKEEDADALSSQQSFLYDHAMNPPNDKVMFYALRTCRHCKKTKEFLEARNVSFDLIYLDDFTGQRRANLMDKVREYNPRGTFPLLLCPDGNYIVGFRETLLQEAFPND